MELTTQTKNQAVAIVDNSNLESQVANTLKLRLLPFFDQVKEWKEKAESLVVTSVLQKKEMKMAREARLALKNIRVEADKTRKALKEDSLRYSSAVQGVYNLIESMIVPIEEHLEKQEKFAEIQEKKMRAELCAARTVEMAPYNAFFNASEHDFGIMPTEEYNKLLDTVKRQKQEYDIAKEKERQERIERERKEAEEIERIRLEYEILKKEAEERERVLQEERREKIRLEVELKQRQEEEAKKKKEDDERILAEEKAKAQEEERKRTAPDKEKLLALAETIGNIAIPEMSSDTGASIAKNVSILLGKTVSYIKDQSIFK